MPTADYALTCGSSVHNRSLLEIHPANLTQYTFENVDQGVRLAFGLILAMAMGWKPYAGFAAVSDWSLGTCNYPMPTGPSCNCIEEIYRGN